VLIRRELLDPRRHGFYALQLFSHKVLRRLMAIPLLVLAVSSALLRRRSPLYAAAAAVQGAVYLVGVIGLLAGGRPAARSRLFAAPTFFVLVNAASLRALLNVVTRRDISRWEPGRKAETAEAVPAP
jgi:hypothetical protein